MKPAQEMDNTMTKDCVFYFRYYSWENPHDIIEGFQRSHAYYNLKPLNTVADARGAEAVNFLNLIEDLSKIKKMSLVIPSLSHLEEFVSDINLLINFFDLLIENEIVLTSIDDSFSTNEHAEHFLRKLAHAIEKAKRALKSSRIREARISAKNAGEQVGALKKRDDQKIHELRKKGLTIREIANELGLSTYPVSVALKT